MLFFQKQNNQVENKPSSGRDIFLSHKLSRKEIEPTPNMIVEDMNKTDMPANSGSTELNLNLPLRFSSNPNANNTSSNINSNIQKNIFEKKSKPENNKPFDIKNIFGMNTDNTSNEDYKKFYYNEVEMDTGEDNKNSDINQQQAKDTNLIALNAVDKNNLFGKSNEKALSFEEKFRKDYELLSIFD